MIGEVSYKESDLKLSPSPLLKKTTKCNGKVKLPGESQGRGSLVGCHLWGRTELDLTEAT